jgi:hypothetical protein
VISGDRKREAVMRRLDTAKGEIEIDRFKVGSEWALPFSIEAAPRWTRA